MKKIAKKTKTASGRQKRPAVVERFPKAPPKAQKREMEARRPQVVSASGGNDRMGAPLYRPVKKLVSLRVDADVLEWFRSQGEGYQTRMNAILRREMLLRSARDAKRVKARGA